VRALLRKKKPANCQNECGKGNDPVPQQRVALWADGDWSCARFQALRIFARCGGFMSGLMSGVYPADVRNKKPIPSLWNRLNVSGIFSVIVQRLPQLADCYAEAAVKINERIVKPQAASKLLPADDITVFFQKRDEEPIRLLLQLDASPILQELTRGDVDLKRAELVDNSRMCQHIWAPQP